MIIFRDILDAVIELMHSEFTLFGEYTFSWFSILAWSIIASIVVLFVGKFFGGGNE